MVKVKHYAGIDISKDTFDVYCEEAGHRKYENSEKGFKALVKSLKKGTLCVMEATGSYHHRLAMYLYEHGLPVSVVNPLIIKRFIQMKLQRSKTDKSDARLIERFAREQTPGLWQPEPAHIRECKMIQVSLGLYKKQGTALKNKLHSLASKGVGSGVLVRSLRRQLKALQKEIEVLEAEMERLIKAHHPEMLASLGTVPGIGRKTALLLISSTNAFSSFGSYRQVSAYFGMAPTERSSGTSIRGRGWISKKGDPMVRNHLFLCSFMASVHNPQCRQLYARLVAKGKSKKLALIAVANKLIKQSFAIARSGLCYDMNYKSNLPMAN